MSLANAAWIWVPLLAIATIAARSGMNDIASSRASIADQLPVLQRLHLWLLSLLYLATFGSFIGFLRVLPCWQNPVPGCEYSAPAFLAHLSVPSRDRLVVLFPINSAACG